MKNNTPNIDKNSKKKRWLVKTDRSTLLGIREKLISIFIIIKVLPLIVLAVFAAKQIGILGTTVKGTSEQMVGDSRLLVGQVGELAVGSSIKALDRKSRESIERLTTDTALAVADFLYARDDDIRLASAIPVSEKNYRLFLENRQREVVYHSEWVLDEQGSAWVPKEIVSYPDEPFVTARSSDNQKDFHYRFPHKSDSSQVQPIYHEMTFVGLDGQEVVKISATDLLSKELHNVADKRNTWCRAENYFEESRSLGPGEIYVSRVIGPYLPSPIIGPFIPKRAEEKQIQFKPEAAGYSGKENPVGKRFQGVVRWVTPVFKENRKIGYVTLALDHTHLMEFTDHIVPTEERYSDISDASSGNYAFMWDFAGRNISHPRDYFIVGFNPETGEQQVPWLSSEFYDLWLSTGQSFTKFEQKAPQYQDQSLKKKPAPELTKAGMLALDCRYLNFAPQCSGWQNLTQYGGSGSFVIFWSNLWKLTTAAAIPYNTGMYSESPRGFGFVTIGANVDEFHSSATETATLIQELTEEYETNLDEKRQSTLLLIDSLLKKTINNLTISTLIMIVLMILIAIWMASTLTGRITAIIDGLKRFQGGELSQRLEVNSQDEIGDLAKAFNEMSDEIESSMQEIEEAKDRAEESDKAKSLFLANMSHEIRTPMNAIIGMSRLALKFSQDEKQKKLLESVTTSSDALLSIVNDILDFSKIEAGQLDLEEHMFSVRGVVDSAVKSVSVLAEAKDIELSYLVGDSVPTILKGDSTRLRQVLLNLLGNGVKFTREGSVYLEVKQKRVIGRSCELLFIVKDTGVGIAPENIEMIFDRFSQTDHSVARKHQGTGLGLAISRKLCYLMGGDITVESKLGTGSTFTFTLIFTHPDSSGHDAGIEQADANVTASTSWRVLLVEDNDANRKLAKMVLEQENHSVETAENGRAALQALTEHLFDVVLLDIQMPVLDGFSVTRLIRSCEKGRALKKELPMDLEEELRKQLYGHHLPIIALTAHAMRGDKDKCLAAGMDDYITKPFMASEVMAAMGRLVKSEQESVTDRTKQATSTDTTLSLYDQAKANLKAAYLIEDEQVEQLMATTVTNIQNDMSDLVAAVESRDWHTVERRAHSLKGVLLNLRLSDEAALATSLQKEWNDADYYVVMQRTKELHVMLERLTNYQ